MSRESFEPWDSDHTALVHVLWEAKRMGLTVDAYDALASHIMTSSWMAAVRLHAREAALREVSTSTAG